MASDNNIENKKTLTNAQVIRYGIFLFMAGLAFARNEYNVSQIRQSLSFVIEKYVITNDYDKKIININIDNLRTQVDINSKIVKQMAEFIKPDEENYNSFKPKRK